MTARDRAMELTRGDIVDAAAALLRDEHPAAITVPAVAERAGVSVRTVYRHFATKADLLDATSRRFLQRVGLQDLPATSSELAKHLGELWPAFADDVDAVRAEHATPEGRALRSRRLDRARVTVRAAVDEGASSLDDGDRDRLADLLIAMTSSAMFLELCDRLGRDADDAAATVAWAVDSLVAHAANTGSIGR